MTMKRICAFALMALLVLTLAACAAPAPAMPATSSQADSSPVSAASSVASSSVLPTGAGAADANFPYQLSDPQKQAILASVNAIVDGYVKGSYPLAGPFGTDDDLRMHAPADTTLPAIVGWTEFALVAQDNDEADAVIALPNNYEMVIELEFDILDGDTDIEVDKVLFRDTGVIRVVTNHSYENSTFYKVEKDRVQLWAGSNSLTLPGFTAPVKVQMRWEKTEQLVWVEIQTGSSSGLVVASIGQTGAVTVLTPANTAQLGSLGLSAEDQKAVAAEAVRLVQGLDASL